MFNEEKVGNIIFYGHFTPWFWHLRPHMSQTVIKIPMILLQAIYTGLMLTFKFLFSSFEVIHWVLNLLSNQKYSFCEFASVFDSPSGVPNHANDWKNLKKDISNWFMRLKLEKEGSRPIIRPKRQISIIFNCFQVLKTIENLKAVQNIWTPYTLTLTFCMKCPHIGLNQLTKSNRLRIYWTLNSFSRYATKVVCLTVLGFIGILLLNELLNYKNPFHLHFIKRSIFSYWDNFALVLRLLWNSIVIFFHKKVTLKNKTII